MKKRWISLMLALCLLLCLTACSDGGGESSAPESSNSSPKGFVFDTTGLKPESFSNLWTACNPKYLSTGALLPEYADELTNKENWPTVLANTSHLKLYIEYIGRASAPELRKIANFVKENKLWVTVEVAGVRAANVSVPDNEAGRAAGETDFLNLFKFIKVGGRVDYITTDHAIASEITGRTSDRPTMTMETYIEQQIEYYKYMKEQMPNVKMGAIESLGFFRVKGENFQYEQTDPTLPNKINFEDYMSKLVQCAKDNGITIDHFHIDFGYHDIEHDGNWGRVLAVEDYCHSLGVKSGFIAGNAFHKGSYPLDNDRNLQLASESAAQRTLQYFEEYIQAGGRSDYLLFQRWQPAPVELGNESTPISQFGIYKSMLDSPYFPKTE